MKKVMSIPKEKRTSKILPLVSNMATQGTKLFEKEGALSSFFKQMKTLSKDKKIARVMLQTDDILPHAKAVQDALNFVTKPLKSAESAELDGWDAEEL